MGHKRHPLSKAWYDMSAEERQELADDIKANGLREPLVRFEGMVLDGWQRGNACQMAGVPVTFVEFEGDYEAAADFVRSKQAHRKSLTPSQKAGALLATRNLVAEWRAGRAQAHAPGPQSEDPNPFPDLPQEPKPSVGQLAEEAGVSRRTMTDALTVENAGQLDRVTEGGESVRTVAEEIRKQREPKPPRAAERKPTKMERLQIKVGELETTLKERDAALADRDEKLRVVTDELESYHNATQDVQEQKKAFEQLRSTLRVVESQRDEHMNECTAWKQRCKALERRLG